MNSYFKRYDFCFAFRLMELDFKDYDVQIKFKLILNVITQIAAMQEALKRMKEEEEKLRLEEEAKIKAAEEAERQRQEKVYENLYAINCK